MFSRKPEIHFFPICYKVDPELVTTSRTGGAEEPVVYKGEREELNCTTKRSYPPANFSWRYQPLDCTGKTCTSYNARNWKPIPDVIGQVSQSSPSTSVLAVPANIDKMYFKCTAVNPVTRGRDTNVYKFIRRGK